MENISKIIIVKQKIILKAYKGIKLIYIIIRK